jgi:hypothetical protein
MVMERGAHSVADGVVPEFSLTEAGKAYDVTSEWKHVEFDSEFVDAPVVLATSTSDGKGPYVVKTTNVTETGFDVMITDE